ncbi:receptor-like protein 7 [Tripterygium wilfordii]|uniref:receptor-like protein 7 n=1 Tax=Tripterygium wilfordii TaxID=458696 RepID=UPI0018F81215|nr:receptor-like protein 7 [Tripterygium wilfordii]
MLYKATRKIRPIKDDLRKSFDIKDLGHLLYFLDIEVTRSRRVSYGMPFYLTNERLDITFAVSIVSQYMHSPRTLHLDVVYHIHSRIKATSNICNRLSFALKYSKWFEFEDTHTKILTPSSRLHVCLFNTNWRLTLEEKGKSKTQQIVSQLLMFSAVVPKPSSNTSLQLCFHYDRLALIEFKSNFSLNINASYHCPTSYPKTKSWKEGRDCCSWDGVTCDTVTGRVIGLDLSCSLLHGSLSSNNSLFRLSHLQKLNLAGNDFSDSKISLEFREAYNDLNSKISPKFGQLKSLTHLNLSYSSFLGEVPSEISHLSNLISLDISYNWLMIEDLSLKRLVQNCSLLKQLLFMGLNLSSIDTNSLMNLSSSLTDLRLQSCGLQGKFPSSILYLPHLHILDLSYNDQLNIHLPKSNWSSPLQELHFDGVPFTGDQLPESIGDLNSLKQLTIGGCDFAGSIPAWIGNLLQLTLFGGEYNNFNGRIPSSLINLSKLEVLSLYNNKLVGPLPNFLNLSKLVTLYLSRNSLNGTIQSVLYNLPFSLHSLDLSSNQFTGPINEFQFQSLEELGLGGNKLNGSVPSSIFNLVNLTLLDLSSSSFSGTLDVSMFSNLKNLQVLLLSDNEISFTTNTFPNNLRQLSLASCNVTEFPYFLRDLKDLERLDLSNNRLSGQVPEWFLEVGIDTLIYLNLANNSLTGIKEIPWKFLQVLDLHSNLLQGLLPIPIRMEAMAVYLISNNDLTGEIPSWICNTTMRFLDLSSNSFSGTIPPCFRNKSQGLKVLNLRNNKFSGKIPDIFKEGCGLLSLNLNDNQLKGPLPRSLVNCKLLELVDLGNNRINDTFPHWLKNLSELQVLVLKSNSFHGSIQDCKDTNCFSKLQIFDISNNEFFGPLPVKYFENLQAMMKSEEGSGDWKHLGANSFSYQDSVFVVMKGQEYQLVRIIMTFKTIDFSNNKFQGEIPDVIGKLTYLKGLNISHNSIGGGIPLSLGNLRNLEWLDLSSNRLIGKIPEQLTGLTFLSHLNLSHNKLVGPIPRSTQFDTFDNSSYKGNLGLCGFPLSKTCRSNGAPPQSQPLLGEEDDSGSDFDWKIIMMGYSSGLVLGLSLGYIMFVTRKPEWLVRLIEGSWLKQVKRPNERHRRRRNS